MGKYYFLNFFVMTHCALYIHHFPIISLSICSLTLSIFLHGSEAFYYYTAPVNFYVLFPILVSCKYIPKLSKQFIPNNNDRL